MQLKSPTNNAIALVFGIVSCGLTVFIFAASRNDPGLRMAALVSATGTVSALLAIASTLLTGKDVTKPDASELPPGSSSTQLSEVKIPPIIPTQAGQPAEKE